MKKTIANCKRVKIFIMNENQKNKPQGAKKAIFIAFLSSLAGVINGFVGTGGGIIMVFLLFRLCGGGEENTKIVFARTLLTVFPMSFAALTVYLRNSAVDTELILRVALPAALGGIAGALLMDRIDKRLLNLIFSFLVIYSGISMVRG